MANKSRIAEAYVQVIPVIQELAEAISEEIQKGYEEAYKQQQKNKLPAPETDDQEWEQAGKGGAKAFGAAMVSGIAALGLGAIVSSQISKALDQQGINASIAGALALSPEQQTVVEESIKNLYKNAYGESYEQVADTMKAIVTTVTGAREASGEELEKMGKDALNLASTFDLTAEQIAVASQVAIQNGLAKDWDEAQSVILAGYQTFGEQGDDWLDSIREFSDDFVKFGFTGQEAVNLVAASMKAGVRETDILADSLNEMGIRLENTQSFDAISALGLDPQAMRAAVQQGGDAAQDAFIEILTRIQASGEQGAVLGEAVFGTRFEDYQTAFMSLDLSNVKAEADGVIGSMDTLDSTINDAANISLTTFQRSFESAFIATLMPTLEAVTPMLQDLAAFMSENAWAAQTLAVVVGVTLVGALVLSAANAWANVASFGALTAARWADTAATTAQATAQKSLMGVMGKGLLKGGAVVGAGAAGYGLGTLGYNAITSAFGGEQNYAQGWLTALPFLQDWIAPMATGGTVLPKEGGTLVRLAEAGRAETVVDTGNMNALISDILSSGGTGGSVFHIYQQPGESTEELVKRIEEYQYMNGLGD